MAQVERTTVIGNRRLWSGNGSLNSAGPFTLSLPQHFNRVTFKT